MHFVKSFSSISREDYKLVGYLASDLAFAHEKKLKVPLSFLITSEAYNLFINKNGLKNKIVQIFHGIGHEDIEGLGNAYLEIKRLFMAAEVPEEILEEVFESYHSLGGSISDVSAQGIISQQPNPRVSVFKSPTYVMEEDDMSGMYLNVKGQEFLEKAIKLSWASLFSPKSTKYRLDNGISHPESCGVVIQRFFTRGRPVHVQITNANIVVKAYFGIVDVHDEFSKDEFIVDREYLQIKESNVKYQDYFIGLVDENLVRINLKDKGSQQKLNDKEVMEAARQVKRLSQMIGKNVNCDLMLKNDKWYILDIYRKTSPEPVQTIAASNEEKEIVEEIQKEESEFVEKVETEDQELQVDVEVDEPVFNFDEQKEVEPQTQTYEVPKVEVETYESTSDEPMAFDTYDSKVEEETAEEPENTFPEPTPVYEEKVEIVEESSIPESNEYSQEPEVKTEDNPEEEYLSFGNFEEKKEEYVSVDQVPKSESADEDNDFFKPQTYDTQEESSDNEFIMPITDEPVKEANNTQDDEFYSQTSGIIESAFSHIGKLAMKKYYNMYGDAAESIQTAISDLIARGVLDGEVSRIVSLRDKYQNGNNLSSEELVFVIQKVPQIAAKLK